MSHWAEGALVLGWEVMVEDAVNYNYEEGVTEVADDAIHEAMVNIGRKFTYGYECAWSWSAYDPYPEHIWIGVEIMDNNFAIMEKDGKRAIDVFCEKVANEADALCDVANVIYRSIMGKEPDEPPKVMVIGMEC